MIFKWTVVSSILDFGERTDIHMESCIRQMEKNSPSTDCLQGWGWRFRSLQPQGGA